MLLLDYERRASLESAPAMTNCNADIAFIGLTPGYQQLRPATKPAREHLSITAEERTLALRRKVAFAGSMRRTFLSMFDQLGPPDHLRMVSTKEPFTIQLERIFAGCPQVCHTAGQYRRRQAQCLVRTGLLVRDSRRRHSYNPSLAPGAKVREACW